MLSQELPFEHLCILTGRVEASQSPESWSKKVEAAKGKASHKGMKGSLLATSTLRKEDLPEESAQLLLCKKVSLQFSAESWSVEVSFMSIFGGLERETQSEAMLKD